MNKTLIVLFTLFLVSQVICDSQNTSTTTNSSSLQGSRNGKVTLYKGYGGFYVGGDFKNDYSHANDEFGPYTRRMLLGLYSSQTVLTNACLGFSNYYCSNWDYCYQTATYAAETYPYFSASGVYARTVLYVDYNKWNLQSTYNAIIATLCTSKTTYGDSAYGIIGLGVKGSAYSNFGAAFPVFSIYLQKDLKRGALMFYKDYSYAKTTMTAASIYTDQNWQGWLSGYLNVGNTYVGSISSRVIFDVNADAIGFPSSYYSSILNTLRSYYSVNCLLVYEKPTCTYYGYISSLPNIYINNGTTIISIPPEIYVQNSKNSSYMNSITLNLRALGSSLSGNNYVTPSYDNYVILDSNFMAYYYTIFDASSLTFPRIDLYYAIEQSNSNNGNLAPYIGVGVFCLIFIIAICRSCCCKAPKTVTVVTTTQAPPTIIAPLIINEQPQFYPQNVQYTQQPYGYIQPQPQIYSNVPTYNYGQPVFNGQQS